MIYVSSYHAIATNVSTTQLAAGLSVQPHDLAFERLLGLTVDSDVTTTSLPNHVTRSLQWHDDGTGPLAPGAPTASALEGLYRSAWAKPLGTPLTTPPVTFHE